MQALRLICLTEVATFAVTAALADAQVQYADIELATVGYVYGGTCCGQRALYELGLTGIPIYNVPLDLYYYRNQCVMLLRTQKM